MKRKKVKASDLREFDAAEYSDNEKSVAGPDAATWSYRPLPAAWHRLPQTVAMQRACPGPLKLPLWSIGVYSLNSKNQSVEFRHAACGRRVGRRDPRQATILMEVAVHRNHRVRRSVQ